MLTQGLAFPSISSQKFVPPFWNMVIQEVLAAPQFSIWLNPDSSDIMAGELTFGGIDHARYTGEFQTVFLSSAG